jgi:hypothetical protein
MSWSVVSVLVLVIALVSGCKQKVTPPPLAAQPARTIKHIQPGPPTRAAKPPNRAIRTPMMPSYKVPDRDRNIIEVPSQIHDVQIKSVVEADGHTLVVTITNNGEPLEIERAGLIYIASILPQDPPVLWETFARELKLPLRLGTREQVSARVLREDVLGYGAQRLKGKARNDEKLLPSGISLIDGNDGMHWYSVEGVHDFLWKCLEEGGPK